MRIITWNVNGLRAVEKKGEIQNLITTYDPDLIFMQEIKGTPDKFSAYLNAPTPYVAYYNPAAKAGYAGTGVWIHERVRESYEIEYLQSFPEDPTATEGRVSHVVLTPRHEGQIPLHIFGIYFPNGGKSEEAWQDKLVFYRAFSAYMDTLRATGAGVLWGGDINCAHHVYDLARPRENDGKIGFHPLERAWLDSCVTDGWQDLWRVKNPDAREVYSWWDPVTRSRDRNVGWRIDALWGDTRIMDRLTHIQYLTDHMGSDHCPMMVEIEG